MLIDLFGKTSLRTDLLPQLAQWSLLLVRNKLYEDY